MDFMEVIRQRRSTRSFKTKPIPDSVISNIIEAGRLSPSPGNGQNWYFGVVTDKSQREKLAHAAGEQMWILSAPCIISFLHYRTSSSKKLTKSISIINCSKLCYRQASFVHILQKKSIWLKISKKYCAYPFPLGIVLSIMSIAFEQLSF